MIKNLVIVESPAKAKTIEKFLGEDFVVKSCFGHIRDLSPKELSVDIENGFIPKYEIPEDKVKIVKELTQYAQKAETVWLASDEDREGEAISWHLVEALNLDKNKIKRIAFHEITKTAISEAIANPRAINTNLVDAQQARRVLDRLVGYELSPLLWKKIRPALSAGRVQSVAVRLIVEREEEIKNFKIVPFFKVSAVFIFEKDGKSYKIKAEIPGRFNDKGSAEDFLKKCIDSEFSVYDIETKPTRKSPAPPFTTSTLQQEAGRKLGFSVSKTMLIAQQLYESGFITYMRTDSVNLSNLALATAKKEIENIYGPEYVKTRNYVTKSKGAQEAHEAIRPTYINQHTIEGNNDQKKLYDLIWKRTIASQMSDAELEKTTVSIKGSKLSDYFIATGEVIRFDGFLKVYFESSDDDEEETQKGMLPPLEKGLKLQPEEITATERFTQQPSRYTEASLVKKLEELGIGRPSTYAPIISTIQKREYVVISNVEGTERNYVQLTLKNGKITERTKKEIYGYEKAKLLPTDIGIIVTHFLMQNFQNIMDYGFTASVEKEFDEIAEGKKVWNEMIKEFYKSFHEKVAETQKTSKKISGARLLGVDPVTKQNIYVKLGRFGGMIQLGENADDVKPRFVGLLKGQSIDTITLEEALMLLNLPKNLGKYENQDVVVGVGKFGPFIRHGNKFYSIKKAEELMNIDLEKAIKIINERKTKKEQNVIKTFDENPDIKILKGRYGPYIFDSNKNYKIPKDKKPEDLTLKDCLDIIHQASTETDIKPKEKPSTAKNALKTSKKTIKTTQKTTKSTKKKKTS